MNVKIGNFEITDVTIDDLKQLIAEFGTGIEASQSVAPKPARERLPREGPADRDQVLLAAFVEAAPAGVRTKQMGKLLGKGGKSIRPAARKWAFRIGLTNHEHADPFEDCRVGTDRGVRIDDDLLELARKLNK